MRPTDGGYDEFYFPATVNVRGGAFVYEHCPARVIPSINERRYINVTTIIFAVITIIVLTAQNTFAQFRETKQFTSNNIIALAGNVDTLWLATERGFNYQTHIDPDGVWLGFEDNGLGGRLGGLEFGGGAAAAILYKDGDSIGFWQFDHASKVQKSKYFRFSNDLRGDSVNLIDPTGSMAYARGNFWVAFGYGGLVRYDPKENTVHAIRPEDKEEVSPDKLAPLNGNDNAKVVKEIGVIKGSGGDSLIWVETLSKKIWTYNPANKAWGTIDAKPADSVYAVLDSMERSNGFTHYPSFAKAGNNPYPEINCMLFLPSAPGADSGTLAIGTTTGLYICRSAKPLSGEYGEFFHVKYVRSLKSGESYALPGILRGSWDGRYDKCVFVYKLKKEGKVTIKVYDYNMSLVKTAVKGKNRPSGKDGERSTNPASDVWDGTNEAGKRVWPGVYYYKITSTGGDRFFGKIILAK